MPTPINEVTSIASGMSLKMGYSGSAVRLGSTRWHRLVVATRSADALFRTGVINESHLFVSGVLNCVTDSPQFDWL